MREVILDTETTGLDPASGDRVVEIGCLELINHIPTGREWHTYLDPQRDMPQAAFEVHGLSTEFLTGKPLFTEISEVFLEFIADDPLVIHNAGFDIGFLNAELEMAGAAPIHMQRVTDTLALARRKHPGASNSLDALCRRYGIDNSERTTHGALIDCGLLASVYVELIGGHQARLELANRTGQRRRSGESANDPPARPAPVPPRLTDAERKAHRHFVAELGQKAIWKRYWASESGQGG